VRVPSAKDLQKLYTVTELGVVHLGELANVARLDELTSEPRDDAWRGPVRVRSHMSKEDGEATEVAESSLAPVDELPQLHSSRHSSKQSSERSWRPASGDRRRSSSRKDPPDVVPFVSTAAPRFSRAQSGATTRTSASPASCNAAGSAPDFAVRLWHLGGE